MFAGKTEADVFQLIVSTLGSLSLQSCPELSSLPNYSLLLTKSSSSSATLRQSLNTAGTSLNSISSASMGLLERLLVYSPEKRISAKLALSNIYFLTTPVAPSDPAQLEPMSAYSR